MHLGRVLDIAGMHGLIAGCDRRAVLPPSSDWAVSPPPAALENIRADSCASGGITTNCIAPGWVETGLADPQTDARAARRGGDRDAGIAALLAEKQTGPRISDPAEIGAPPLVLCDPIGHNVTGRTIPSMAAGPRNSAGLNHPGPGAHSLL